MVNNKGIVYFRSQSMFVQNMFKYILVLWPQSLRVNSLPCMNSQKKQVHAMIMWNGWTGLQVMPSNPCFHDLFYT